VSADAVSTRVTDGLPHFGTISKVVKGRNGNVSALFQISSHAVVGRLRVLSVFRLRDLNVTPRE